MGFRQDRLRCINCYSEIQIGSLATLDTDWPYMGICRSFFLFVFEKKILAGEKIMEKATSPKTRPPERSRPGRIAWTNRDRENHRRPKIRPAVGFVTMGDT